MEKVKKEITAINYKKATIPDEYNQLTIRLKGDFGVLFRAYNDGVAYRLFTSRKEDLIVKDEVVNFNFVDDHIAFIPFVRDLRGSEIYVNSFEALYKETNISKINKDTLGFLPLLVDVGDGKKARDPGSRCRKLSGDVCQCQRGNKKGTGGGICSVSVGRKTGRLQYVKPHGHEAGRLHC